MALEQWISRAVFREDASRVFLASNDYAFRRRFELTDMSRNFNDIEISSLKFPFANYWPLNSSWEPDNRVAALNAKLMYEGIYENDVKIKAIPSTISIGSVFYFDREDDARLAYEMIYYHKINEHYYSTIVPFGGNTLEIPVNMEIVNITFNPDTNESSWLQNNRIFTIKVDFKLRSYVLFPPEQPNYKLDLDVNGYLSDGTLYGDGIDKYFLTEEVILRQKNFNDLYTSILTIDGSIVPSDIKINKLIVSDVSQGSAKISWEFPEDNDITRISITLNGKSEPINISPEKNFYILDNLNSGAYYIGYITFYSSKGSSKKLSFVVETLKSQEQIEISNAPTNSLIGVTW